MLRVLKNQYKYRCIELACGRIVRSDKWNNHCKTDHGFKFARDEIKKKIVQIRNEAGPWKPFSEPSEVREG